MKLKGIGRFQVMALLQAARYYLLTGDLDAAKSWGLNRAIFYAWAKYYGPHRQPYRSWRVDRIVVEGGERKRKGKCPEGMIEVFGECVQKGPRGFFSIGGEEQTPRDFDREVVLKLKGLMDWDRVWKAALNYVKLFPKPVLKDPQRFFKYVYEPVRDTFFTLLLKGEEPRPPPQLLERLQSIQMVSRSARHVSLEDFISSRSRSSRVDGESPTAGQPRRASRQESGQSSS